MKYKHRHTTYTEGCNPCKWRSLSFFDVPGGQRDLQSDKPGKRTLETDLNRYRAKRQAGENPRSIRSKGPQGMDQSTKLQDTWSDNEKAIRDDNSPEAVKVIKKTLLNE